MDLTDIEIDEICGGLVQNHAKIKFLQGLGLTVRRKPNGKPLINRQHYQNVMTAVNGNSPAPMTIGPRWSIAA